ncbi:hypothetical protein MMC28_008377 [Mycoblastus sanguinarius]|nr:hypothetical protein [Mycoblastus sanguinarius]
MVDRRYAWRLERQELEAAKIERRLLDLDCKIALDPSCETAKEGMHAIEDARRLDRIRDKQRRTKIIREAYTSNLERSIRDFNRRLAKSPDNVYPNERVRHGHTVKLLGRYRDQQWMDWQRSDGSRPTDWIPDEDQRIKILERNIKTFETRLSRDPNSVTAEDRDHAVQDKATIELIKDWQWRSRKIMQPQSEPRGWSPPGSLDTLDSGVWWSQLWWAIPIVEDMIRAEEQSLHLLLLSGLG